ncbi:MAG: PAS domain-containing protein [Alphaproteobacteria bacterium]
MSRPTQPVRMMDADGGTMVGMAPAIEPDWHPDLKAFVAYWQTIRPGPGTLPGRRDVDPSRIVRLLPDVWMLDVQVEPFRLRYRLAGTRMVAMHGREITGLWLDEAHPDMPTTYFDRYRRVCETHAPSWRRGSPRLDPHSRAVTVIENVLLPLAADGRNVDILFCLTKVNGPAGEMRF